MRTRRPGGIFSFTPQTALGLAAVLAAHGVAQDRPGSKPKIPAWQMAAREAMQVRGAYGLVFVMPKSTQPPTDELERRRLAERSGKVWARMHVAMRVTDTACGVNRGMAAW